MPTLSSSLLTALTSGDCVIAPTALSAATLRHTYDRRQLAAGHAVWRPANVFSWQQWLGSLWTGLIVAGHEARLLLNPAQEELLWRELIVPTLAPANAAGGPAFAALAQSAYALAASYNVTGRLAGAAQTEDTEQFAGWAAEFTRTCGRHGYLPAARLAATLAEHLGREHFPAPTAIHMVDFLDLPPADADLLNALQHAGTRVFDHPRVSVPAVERLTLRAESETDELRAIAHWVREFLDTALDAGSSTDVPTVHIVLAGSTITPAALDGLFREVLAPELDLVSADLSSAPWEHAAGQPLAEQPMVATLLRLLQGFTSALPIDDVTALLLSPFLGPRHDRDAAAQLDAWSVRQRPPLRPEMTMRELHSLVQRSPYGAGTLAWLKPLLRLLDSESDLAAPRTYAKWTAFLRDAAAAAGWPGGQTLGPFEQATLRAWDHVLDSLATLDFTGRRVPFAEALSNLERQAQGAAVHLSTYPPIRVISASEAAVTSCDVLVLAQATDSNWPPAARPHPLLPWSLQTAVGMPGTHPAADAARAQRLTETLIAATPVVLLTHAAEANEAPQRLAPSLVQLTSTGSQQAWRALDPASLLSRPALLVLPEQVPDTAPLDPLPSAHVEGGAAVLQLQAACGFRAFAELRLRSTEPNLPELGMDARRAGSVLHHALDVFWQRVGSQSHLLSLADADRDAHLEEAIRQAFGRMAVEDDPWDKAYRALQMERLFEVLRSWMTLEAQRAPFQVLGREEKRQLQVGPLHLQLRVDRVDEIEDGSGTVLVDYKTGYDAQPSAWAGERPDQPQLPIYTLLPEAANLRGLAFARVRRGQFAWSGLQAEAGLLGRAKVEPGLDRLVVEWRRVLSSLAAQFAAGDHSVNPKSYPVTCTHCGQRFLCRIEPDALLAATEEEPGPDGYDEDATYG